MHQLYEAVPSQRFTLEPWDDQVGARYAVYGLAANSPIVDDEGRTVWIYNYVELARDIHGPFEDKSDDD